MGGYFINLIDKKLHLHSNLKSKIDIFSFDMKITCENMRFENWEYPMIEHNKPTIYNWLVQHPENLKLGYKSDIGAFTYINAKKTVIIEDFVQIGSHCSIYSISTIDNMEGEVVLKKNCKIGSYSMITPGVTIGENSVIGAFSFVNKDIPQNVLAYGVPVKIIRTLKENEF